MASKLRDLKDLAGVVMGSLRISLPAEQAQHICQQIESKEVFIPRRKSLSLHRQKLDLAEMLWQREISRRCVIVRFLSAEASPQIGSNYLGVREDSLVLPRPASSVGSYHADLLRAFSSLTRAGVQERWRTFLWPLTSLGYGAANLTYKLRNVIHCMMLQSNSSAAFDKLRGSVYGGSADQSTESKIWDAAFVTEPTRDHLSDLLSNLGGDGISANDPELTNFSVPTRSLCARTHPYPQQCFGDGVEKGSFLDEVRDWNESSRSSFE